MALQTAAAAKIASDAAVIVSNDMTDSLVMTESINAAITAASIKTDTKERVYAARLDLEANLNSEREAIELIQSDASTVMLRDVEETLRAAGYRVACRSIVTRDGKADKVKMTVAWS